MLDVKKDTDGRWVAVTIHTEITDIHLTAIYAPNKDSPVFFDNVFNYSLNKCDKIIVIGDFNTALNPEYDTKNGVHTNSNTIAKIKQICEENLLIERMEVS